MMPDNNDVVAVPEDAAIQSDAGSSNAIKDEVAGLSGIEWVSKTAEYVLGDSSVTKEAPLSGTDIYNKVHELGLTSPVSENTFSQYLSGAAKLIESPVTSTGRGRGGGYYLSEQSIQLASEATSHDEQAEPKEWGKEKWLYPSLVAWMVGEGYQAEDTSTIRSLGKWGNPDVTGLVVQDYLSQQEIEVVTIEAKLGLDSWETDFFQAVSQRRFANRAYFAFALPEDASDKMPTELRYYSERFQVGVLVVDLSNELYQRLTSGDLIQEDKEFLENNDGGSVRELLSAPWSHVPLKYQRDVCRALKITDNAGLYSWGAEAK